MFRILMIKGRRGVTLVSLDLSSIERWDVWKGFCRICMV